MANEHHDPLEMLPVAELADLWRVHENTIRRLIRDGELASVKVGRRRMVRRDAAEEYLERTQA